jgi:hypothetical protein
MASSWVKNASGLVPSAVSPIGPGWIAGLEIAQQMMVEAHQRHGPVIVFKAFDHRIGKPVIIARTALELENQRHLSRQPA